MSPLDVCGGGEGVVWREWRVDLSCASGVELEKSLN
jgi:hypothetical protein